MKRPRASSFRRAPIAFRRGLSSLMLSPEFIRIKEKALANWVTPAKTNAIRAEFVRQCDALDGLMDGIINNYIACRALFDVTQGAKDRRPWSAKRCPKFVSRKAFVIAFIVTGVVPFVPEYSTEFSPQVNSTSTAIRSFNPAFVWL